MRAREIVQEIIKMPPTRNSSQGMADWAYTDAKEKSAAQLPPLKTTIPTEVYDLGNHYRIFVLDQQGPVFYLSLEKFLDGFKSGAVAAEPRARGKNLAFEIYQAVSDTFHRPIYSDVTQTDASRLAIWNKLLQAFPDRVVGHDQKTNQDLPIDQTEHGPVVRGNQPIYVQHRKKEQDRPVSPQTKSRTRLLKLQPQ